MRLALFMLLAVLFLSCKTSTKVVEVPIETVRTEYINKLEFQHDSIFFRDSVDRYVRGDTVFIEKYRDRYKYKNVVKTDTVCKTDSIQVPVHIETVKEVNKIKGYQNFLMYSGIAFLLGLAYAIYRFVRKFVNK